MPWALSHFQAEDMLKARRAGQAAVTTSLDLNLTTTEVALDAAGVVLPDGGRVAWADVEAVAGDDVGCYVVEADGVRKIHLFSETMNRAVSLMPTRRAPTMLVSGFPMHRIKDVDPWEDTRRKIKAANPRGQVLDTATGLGYTAIQAAKTADHVLTVEIDPTGLEICRLNPWSQPLFTTPTIEQRVGDSFDVVEESADETFTSIIHDPPIMSLAGDLYSTDIYREFHRILRHKGRLFHYIGDPEGKMGANVTRGVVRRLQDAGFSEVVRRPEAFGVLAFK